MTRDERKIFSSEEMKERCVRILTYLRTTDVLTDGVAGALTAVEPPPPRLASLASRARSMRPAT